MTIFISSLIVFLQVATLQRPETGSSLPVYTSEKSKVRLFSEAPLENIEATSMKLRAALNMETGKLLFIIPIKSFEFEKQLMQKHFNDQYLESDKFPEARFDGQFNESPIEINGVKEFGFQGVLTIHGESRNISGTAKLGRNGEIIYGRSTIHIRLEDYKIKIPRMVIKNIAEVVEVDIKVQFTQEIKN